MVETHGYYLSPHDANPSTYHVLPMIADTVKSRIYASSSLALGNANDQGRDGVTSFQGNVYRAQHFGHFQAYYGGNISLGSYRVADFYNSDYRVQGGIFGAYAIPTDTLYHVSGQRTSFGGYGLSGGINFTLPFERFEWRILGIEASFQKEFGSYGRFRDKLPDSAANIIFRKRITPAIGLNTELVWRNRHQVEFGFKASLGIVTNAASAFSNSANEHIFPLTYFSNSFHIGKNRLTGFIQGNFASYADNFQFGVIYRLGRN